MRNKPVTTMPVRASAGWQTLTAEQFNSFNSQVACYQAVRKELEQIPQELRPTWLEGFLAMLMNQFKPQEIIKAA